MKRLGIRRQLLLLNGATMFFLMLFLSASFYFVLNKSFLNDIDSSLHTSCEILKNSIQTKVSPADFYFFKTEVEEIFPKELFIEIVDEDGIVIYKNKTMDNKAIFNKDELKKIFEYKEVYKSLGNQRIILYPFDFYGRLNILVVGKPVAELLRTIDRAIIFLFIVMLIAFAISMMSSFFIMSKMLNALKNITSIARKTEKDSLHHRISQKYNTPEIDMLIETLNEMFERIENGFARISQFTSDASHELKTPIASIKSMIEVELTQTRSADEYKEVLINILEEIDWLFNIINDLLLMTSYESGKDTLYLEQVNIKEIIEDVVELMEAFAEENDVRLITENLSASTINCDKNKIKRVIFNLISNAIKYNKKYGTVTISINDTNEFAVITIKDTGIGIKQENISRVFERFYREDKIRTTKKSGTGLGLSLVEFIVGLHDGVINISSIENVGTSVEVKLKKS